MHFGLKPVLVPSEKLVCPRKDKIEYFTVNTYVYTNVPISTRLRASVRTRHYLICAAWVPHVGIDPLKQLLACVAFLRVEISLRPSQWTRCINYKASTTHSGQPPSHLFSRPGTGVTFGIRFCGKEVASEERPSHSASDQRRKCWDWTVITMLGSGKFAGAGCKGSNTDDSILWGRQLGIRSR